MAGRKPALPASVIIDAVLKFKDEIIYTNDDGKKGKYVFLFFKYYSGILYIFYFREQ